MHRGRTPSKHWRPVFMPVDVGGGYVEHVRVKKLTPAGVRRRNRRRAILEAAKTLLFVGEPLKDAFQEAVRTLGSRPDDRRWAWARLLKEHGT